jgi:hypothetical protein
MTGLRHQVVSHAFTSRRGWCWVIDGWTPPRMRGISGYTRMDEDEQATIRNRIHYLLRGVSPPNDLRRVVVDFTHTHDGHSLDPREIADVWTIVAEQLYRAFVIQPVPEGIAYKRMHQVYATRPYMIVHLAFNKQNGHPQAS